MKTINMIIPNFLLGTAGGIQYHALIKASKDPQKASEKTLRDILTFAKDTVYGREHKFDYILQATDAQELYKRYQENVKPNEYEDLRPMSSVTNTEKPTSFSPASPFSMPPPPAPRPSPNGFPSPNATSRPSTAK